MGNEQQIYHLQNHLHRNLHLHENHLHLDLLQGLLVFRVFRVLLVFDIHYILIWVVRIDCNTRVNAAGITTDSTVL